MRKPHFLVLALGGLTMGLLATTQVACAPPTVGCTVNNGPEVLTETVSGTPGPDVIDCEWATNGHIINGGGGADYLYGSDYPDTINGGAGGDNIWGYGGGDVLKGGFGRDGIYGGGDDDILVGGQDGDWLYGDQDTDTLTGGQAGDYLNGGDGPDDICSGGAGTDSTGGTTSGHCEICSGIDSPASGVCTI